MILESEMLERRLRDGERRIEAELDLNRRQEMEDFWIHLLAEYVAAVDAERTAAAQASLAAWDRQGEAAS